MISDKNIASFYKGRFTGLFEPGNKQPNGYFTIADLRCTYIRIDQYTLIDGVSIEELKTNDFWFNSRIRAKKGMPWHRKSEVFIAVGENRFYSGDLYNVLIKNLEIKYGSGDNRSPIITQVWIELSGDIWFQVEPAQKSTTAPINTEKSNTAGAGINILPEYQQSSTSALLETTTGTSGNGFNVLEQTHLNSRTAITTIHNPQQWLSGFGWLLRFLGAIAIFYYLWKFSPIIAYIFMGALVLFAVTKFIWRNSIFRNILSVVLAAFCLYFLYSIIYRDGIKGDPVKTRSGSVTIDPPKRDDGDQNNGPDYSIGKQIKWYDFINRFYEARYKTSQAAFDQSVAEQNKLGNSISLNNSGDFYAQFYKGLSTMDREKIKNVAAIFRDSAQRKNLNQFEVSEMVVTFIQEIPYFLIHDGSCQQAVENGNDFMQSYHLQRKPCLPNIKGGVQSPYEFLHNLKGDCDTRSLLGFAILTELKIPSSVWISDVYGHSILGVGLPVGHGIYKTIEGIKHYGVELTAKGYRLGMVAPENARALNWDIAIFNNQL
jgi:hypothetical protein